jgi:hypothetical protein
MENDKNDKLLKQIETLLNNKGNEALSAVRKTIDPVGTGEEERLAAAGSGSPLDVGSVQKR